jgi:DNA-binding beta-propeller fold protein YncE
MKRRHASGWLLGIVASMLAANAALAADLERRLYVAVPGIRNYLEYGGHGLLVYDIDHGHKLLNRIKTAGLDPKGVPRNVKGICANAQTGKIYISTTHQLMCLDIETDKLLWEKTYPMGCDRMAMAPDGKTIYLPSFEGPIWYVVNADDGEVISTVEPKSGAHNTVMGPDGREVYLAGLRSPLLSIVDTRQNAIVRTAGPFSNSIRPFSVNGKQTRVFVTVNERLGFEIGDLRTGRVLARVDVPGFEKGPVKRHGCPSHGIGLTPNEREIWVCDAYNERLHVFDATSMPPKYVESIKLKDEPGWVTFTVEGDYAYPSTGDVIDVKTRKIVAQWKDEEGKPTVESEKVVEIDFRDGKPVRAGDQFGVGRVR